MSATPRCRAGHARAFWTVIDSAGHARCWLCLRDARKRWAARNPEKVRGYQQRADRKRRAR